LEKAISSCEVIRLKDGEEAIHFFTNEKLQKLKPKLILLDLKMPKVDGLEVLKKIRSIDGVKELPVVMLTSSKEHKDIIESYNLGVNSYVVKPLSFSEFADTIASIGRYWININEVRKSER
jgi:two-component system response regulator